MHMPGQVDREGTAGARQVADSQNAEIGFDGAPANLEAQSESRFILADLREGQQ
jgi:hypothetical protein